MRERERERLVMQNGEGENVVRGTLVFVSSSSIIISIAFKIEPNQTKAFPPRAKEAAFDVKAILRNLRECSHL